MLDEHHINRVIQLTVKRMLAHQEPDGHFSYCCEVAPLSDAVMVVFLNLLGCSSDPLVPVLCNTLVRRQRPDGSFAVYPGQDANLSTTTLVYFALLLSGFNKTSPEMLRARTYILQHGGITRVSTFVKGFLAVGGQLPWSALPNPHIEMIFWKPSDRISLFDISTPARVHLPSLMILSHLNFSYDLPEDFSMSDLIDKTASLPKPRIVPRNDEAIERCRSFLLERVESNGTLVSYLSATVFMVFALQALGYSNHHPRVARAVNGLKKMVYHGRNFIHQQFFTSSVWDTSLSLQALTAAGVPPTHQAMMRGAAYLVSRQQDSVSDWIHHTPHAKPGGWGFSDVNTLYPDVDDTIAAVKALYPFRNIMPSGWKRGLKWAIAMQNRDGGWSAFDRNCNNFLLQLVSTNDMKQALFDPSTPDLTGRVLETVGFTRARAPKVVSKGMQWLVSQQRSDGAWFGRWGIAYIYGTWAVVQGLRTSGMATNTRPMERALAWFERIQNPDGGFGESCESDEKRTYVPLKYSTASQTAWGLLGMMSASDTLTPQIHRAASFLVESARPSGGWRERYPTGAGIAGQAYIRYHSYPYIWPLLALGAYRDGLTCECPSR